MAVTPPITARAHPIATLDPQVAKEPTPIYDAVAADIHNKHRRPRPSDHPCPAGRGGHYMRRDPTGKRTWICIHPECGLRWPFNEAGDP